MSTEYEKVKAVDAQFIDLKEQNKKIASGILTVAKMLQDHHETIHDTIQTKTFPEKSLPEFSKEENKPVQDFASPFAKEDARPMQEQVIPQAPPPIQASLPPDPYSQAMESNKPKAPPIDPWAPAATMRSFPQQMPPSGRPAPNSPPPFGQNMQSSPFTQDMSIPMPPPPRDSFGSPPPPFSDKKKGVLGLFK
jgi:hypothetical protein